MLYSELKKKLDALPPEKLNHHVTILVTNQQFGSLVQGVDDLATAGEALPGTASEKVLALMGEDFPLLVAGKRRRA